MPEQPRQSLPSDRAERAAIMYAWRWAYRRSEWRRLGVRTTLSTALKRPLVALRQARAAARSSGGTVRDVARSWWLRVVHGVEPRQYYALRLGAPDRWPRAYAVVRDREVTAMARALATRAGGYGRRTWPLTDKLAFAAWACAADIPTVPTLAEIGLDALEAPVAPDEHDLPDGDLFTKRVAGWGGSGARRWTRVAPGRWSCTDEHGTTGPVPEQVDAAGLVAACRAQARETGGVVLVQRAVRNHPAMRGLVPPSSSALSTVRLVTRRDVDGTVTLLLACCRMPTGSAVVDAFSHGGAAAPVDLATGRLGFATTTALAAVGRTMDRHPDTGADIAGTVLPDWAAAVAMVERAHVRAPHADALPWVGWDVALTPTGPIVVEGNVPPSAMLCQVPSGVPLGETPIVATILAYLRQNGST